VTAINGGQNRLNEVVVEVVDEVVDATIMEVEMGEMEVEMVGMQTLQLLKFKLRSSSWG
jgi:hypothetical protein